MSDIPSIEKLKLIMRQQKNNLALLAALEEHSDLSMERYDSEGRLIGYSKKALIKDFGLTFDPLGNYIDDIYPQCEENRTDRIKKTLESGVKDEYEDTIEINEETKCFSSCYIPVFNDHGIPMSVLVISKDITEISYLKRLYDNKDNQFKISIDEAAVSMALIRKEGNFFKVNSACCKFFKYSEEEILSLTLADVTHPSDLEIGSQQFNKCIAERQSLQFEKRYVLKDGSSANALASIGPVFDDEGEVQYVCAIFQDITQFKRTEETLRSSEAALNESLEAAHIGSFSWDKETDSIHWSKQMFTITGIDPNEFEGKLQGVLEKHIHPEDSDSVASQINEMIEQSRSWPLEFRTIRPDGQIRWIRSSSRVIADENGKTTGGVGVNQDITNQKQIEEQMKASLKEKETLLHEIHHRVKNNMQVISSLLKLQAGKTDDQRLKDAFMESQNRIESMSIVHEILHESSNLSKIQLKPYLQRIADSLSHSYQIKHSVVQLEVTGDDIELNVEQANPIGLILNELVSNAYKYAFSEQPAGLITISLKKEDATTIELVVKDNGQGLPEAFDWRNAESLGLQLVITLVENQLDGLIQYESDDGCKFTILFKSNNNL